jgi:hypothetical protein
MTYDFDTGNHNVARGMLGVQVPSPSHTLERESGWYLFVH